MRYTVEKMENTKKTLQIYDNSLQKHQKIDIFKKRTPQNIDPSEISDSVRNFCRKFLPGS